MPKGGWGHGGGFGFGHGWGHGPGFFGGPGLVGAVVAGTACGLIMATHRPPPRYARYRERVVIVQQPPQGVAIASHERLVQLTCPAGVSAGGSLEITVEGRNYYVTVPQGVAPGQTFQAKITLSNEAAVAVATPVAPAAQAQAAPVAMPVAMGQPMGQPVAMGQPIAAPPAAPAVMATSAANPFDAMPPPPPAAGGWAVAPYKGEYDAKFKAAGPGPDNKLAPANVKTCLMQTGLPAETLRPIWELSDIDKDGKLDMDEFAVACYLCWMAGEGQPLPQGALPPELMPPSKGANPF